MSDEKSVLAGNLQFLLDCIRRQFPDRHARVYTIPSVHVNRVPYSVQSFGGESVYVAKPPLDERDTAKGQRRRSPRKTAWPPPVHDSDVRTDAAHQRVLFCLVRMAEARKEAMMVLSQLEFGDYLGAEVYAAATAFLPRPANLPASALPGVEPQKNPRRGDFDVLVIHPRHELIVCEIKSVGGRNCSADPDVRKDLQRAVEKRVNEGVKQMTKAQVMLRHLLSDIAPDLTPKVSLVLPNLSRQDIMQVLCGRDHLKASLGQCLGSRPLPVDLARLCLCADDLSHPGRPWDVTADVIEKVESWWQRLVTTSGKDKAMTFELYDQLLARFCGPATTVTVPCVTRPRLSLRTLPEGVSEAGERFAQITLYQEQVDILQTMARHLKATCATQEPISGARVTSDPVAAAESRRQFVTGPPGTGKSVMLLLAAREWLRHRHDVHVVSSWNESRVASYLLEHLLERSLPSLSAPGQTPGAVHVHEFDFLKARQVALAVHHLVKAAREGALFVVCDEAGPDYGRPRFQDFCDKLLARVPGLHLWAASCQHRHASSHWRCVDLTRPLRSPPVVVREVALAEEISDGDVYPYSESGLPCPTDGPPVKFVSHEGHGHTGVAPHNCGQCGRDVGDFLNSLLGGAFDSATNNIRTSSSSDMGSSSNAASSSSDGETSSSSTSCSGRTTTAAAMRHSDVLVLCESRDVSDKSGLIAGLRQRRVPVRVMTKADARDVVTAASDVVWVTHWTNVLGLERKVVVYVGLKDRRGGGKMYDRLHCLSRCLSQLVWVHPSGAGVAGSQMSGHTRVWQELKGPDKKEVNRTSSSQSTRQQPDVHPATVSATPVFCEAWRAVYSVTCEGGVFCHNSDVVLHVPPDAVRCDAMEVHFGVCGNVERVKCALGLPSDVYVASPLVEFWAGAHFVFAQPVQVKLPHWLPPGLDSSRVRVYRVKRSKVGDPDLLCELKNKTPEVQVKTRGHGSNVKPTPEQAERMCPYQAEQDGMALCQIDDVEDRRPRSTMSRTAEHCERCVWAQPTCNLQNGARHDICQVTCMPLGQFAPDSRTMDQREGIEKQIDENDNGLEEEGPGEHSGTFHVASDGQLYVSTKHLHGYVCVYPDLGSSARLLTVLVTASCWQGHDEARVKITAYVWDQRLAIKDFKQEILGPQGQQHVAQETRIRLLDTTNASSLYFWLEVVGSNKDRWQHSRRHDGTLALPVHQSMGICDLLVGADQTHDWKAVFNSPFAFSWLLETPGSSQHPGPWPLQCVLDISHVTHNTSPSRRDMVDNEVVTRVGVMLPCGDLPLRSSIKGDNPP